MRTTSHQIETIHKEIEIILKKKKERNSGLKRDIQWSEQQI